jgi:transposase
MAEKRESTPAERQRARELRGKGRSYGQIAYMLGRDWTTIYRWLNPEAQRRNRERALRWRKRKPATARRSRRESHHLRTKEKAYGECRSCNGPLSPTRKTNRELCKRCLTEDSKWFYREIQALWKEGKTAAEIAEETGRPKASVTTAIRTMRENGWNVPYRRLDTRRLRLGVAHV